MYYVDSDQDNIVDEEHLVHPVQGEVQDDKSDEQGAPLEWSRKKWSFAVLQMRFL